MLIFHYRRRERLAKEKAAQEAKAAKAAAGKGGTPKNKLSPEIIRQLAAKDQVLDM